MIVSFFEDSNFCTGIDYSERKDCVLVSDLQEEDIAKLAEGMDYKISDGKVTVYEGDNWKKILAQCETDRLSSIEQRLSEIQTSLGLLLAKKSGMIELGEDITEVELKITNLKNEYQTLNLIILE